MRKQLLILAFPLSCLLFNCDRDSYTEVQKVKANAYLVNSLAVDGCSWHFEGIDSKKNYAANNASQGKIDALVKSLTSENGMYRIPVTVQYALTGNKKSIVCGWGRKAEAEEINIYVLKTRKE